MNQTNNNSKPFLESILAIGISTIYMLIAIYFLPIIGILFPISFVILGIRNGIKYNISSMIISTLLLGLVIDKTTGLFILIAFLPISIVLNYSIKKRRNSQQILLSTTIVGILSYIFIMILFGKVTGVGLVKQLEESFSQAIKFQMDLLKDRGISSSQINETKDVLKNLYEYIVLMLPSTVIIFSVFTAFLNSLISIYILRKIGYGIVSVPKFSYFKLPDNVILGTIVIYIGVFIIKILKIPYYKTILINVTSIVSFFFFLEGLSVIIFYLNKSKLNKVIRGIIIIFTILAVHLNPIISIIGFLDIIFDFRRIRRKV
ncbi:YybS family protein [Anaerosalibacter massiliensis]|uniref:YybS family protein n=1 Tax=Anaerosalibacter massiliensis TaxID=1347392 RepID=A0A9X2MIP6_9FIRM|nr:DUF2232 domain-containing protein [Anaerosalibacter massiliensis]MCR2044374.1 YybS family protein [Anaerosalibacter massiliensis]